MYRFITFLGVEILLVNEQYLLKLLSGSNEWSTKVGTKLLSDLVIFSILLSDIPLDLNDSIWVVVAKYSMCFLAGINTK